MTLDDQTTVRAAAAPLCRRCDQPIRGFRQDYDYERRVILVSGTCRCDFQQQAGPDPRFDARARPTDR